MDVIIFDFGPFFALLPSNSPKNQNFYKMKYTSAPKIIIICYAVPEIWHVTDVIVIFHFGLFFAIYPPNSPKNQNYKKRKKKPGDIIILHKRTKNYGQMMYGS